MANIELIHGNSLDAIKKYKDNHFDCAIVDPPYGMGKNTYGSGTKKTPSKFDCSKYNHRQWDIAPNKLYFDELFRVSKNQIIFGANYYPQYLKPSMGWVVWDKDNTGGFSDGELAYTSFNQKLRIYKFRWNGMLQENMKNKEVRIHPTQKPIALYKWLLENYTKEGDLILDTHLGSGSIAIACYYMKRKLIGYEIDKEYYDNACKRFKQQTMQSALW